MALSIAMAQQHQMPSSLGVFDECAQRTRPAQCCGIRRVRDRRPPCCKGGYALNGDIRGSLSAAEEDALPSGAASSNHGALAGGAALQGATGGSLWALEGYHAQCLVPPEATMV